MTIPFYYSYIEFSKDFNHNFNEWLKHYPNGDLKRFKYEYLNLYRPYYNADDKDNIFFEVIESYGINGKLCFDGELFKYVLNDVLNDLLTSEANKRGIINADILQAFKNIDYKNIQEINPFRDSYYYYEIADFCIFKDVSNAVKVFYDFNYEKGGFYFKDNEFTDFGYSVEKIVTFLLDDTKTQPEIPIQEIPQPETPQPKATEKDSLKLTEEQIFLGNGFDVFHEYMNEHIPDSQLYKISFIVQKLKEEGKMIVTNSKQLTIWANDNGYLDNFTYERLLIDACFLSPSKVLTKNRLKRYNELFK